MADVLLWPLLSLPMTALFGSWSGMYGGVQTDSPWLVTAWVLTVAGVLVLSRFHPLAAWLLSTISGFFNPWFIAVAVVTSYRVGYWMPRTRPAMLGFAAIVTSASVLTVLPRWRVTEIGSIVMTLLTVGLVLVFAAVLPWLTGRYWRYHRQLADAGWERAEQLEREQRILAEQAQLRERTRIAQDMHDSLGHELSLIALRAAGLQVAPDLDERHRDAAKQLRIGAATATERLREIIGVLRDDSASAPTQPAREDIASLVERTRDSGMRVDLRQQGDPARLTPMAERAVHRVVLESLTNAAKHAPGATVTVTVRHTGSETVVSVVNAAPPSPAPVTESPGNRGLLGLRERVRLAGGTLHAGPVDAATADPEPNRAGTPGAGTTGARATGVGTTPAGATDARTTDTATTDTAPAGGGFEVVARLPHLDVLPDPAETPSGAPEHSESARHLERVQRRARRGLVATMVVPAGLAAFLGALMLGVYVLVGHLSVLPPEEFVRLRLGQPRGDVEAALPPLQMLDAPVERGPAAPPGTVCRHYRPQGPPGIRYAYRLCFTDRHLVAKYAVPTGSTRPSDVPTEGTGTL